MIQAKQECSLKVIIRLEWANMNLPKIERDNDCIYMLQDISGLTGYERAKAIVNFCDKETKVFEKEIDRAILDIFDRNGIKVSSTKKSALKLAFDRLKAKRKSIKVENITDTMYQCEKIQETKLFVVYLEDNDYLEVATRVKEIDL